jgi:N-acetylglucosaminyl-diphospho-decaprenol L-rhamnosyltransferase
VRVAVIIVNYNSGALLQICLDGLASQTFRCFDVIVVDNGSTDGSVDSLERVAANVRIIQAGENLGFARANNLAAGETNAEWLALLNPDALPAPDWLERLLEATARHPAAASFGSTQIDGSDHSVLDGAGDAYHVIGANWRSLLGRSVNKLPPEGETFAACAAAALYRRAEFIAQGGFDERFFCYIEDVDLGFRLRLAGYRCVQVPSAVVLHKGSAITGRGSAFVEYHTTRNAIWTYVKNMPLLLLLLGLPFHLLFRMAFLARAVGRGTHRECLRGLRDAIAGLGPIVTSRRGLQASRTASIGDIARALTWSPIKLLSRSSDIRPRRIAAPGS